MEAPDDDEGSSPSGICWLEPRHSNIFAVLLSLSADADGRRSGRMVVNTSNVTSALAFDFIFLPQALLSSPEGESIVIGGDIKTALRSVALSDSNSP